MKREAGFTMVEMLIAVVVMLIIVATTLGTLTQAIYATEGVGLMAKKLKSKKKRKKQPK